MLLKLLMMKNNKTVGIYTLGCRVNMYESCVIAERLKTCGFTVKRSGNCDYYIVNTCAVTSESERKSRQLIRRCAAIGKVLVVGCASQLNREYSEIPNVIYNGGNRNKLAVIDVLRGESICADSVKSMENADYEQMCLNGTDELFSECRAFIKIQDGCNGKCTYCIIPKCRGGVRSRDAYEIVCEARRLAERGYKEVILTGIEVGAYNKIRLYELLNRVSEVDGVRRLRLGSLSPNVINDEFLSSIAENSKFMPHIHLSLQSCNDRILQLMKRPYRKKEIAERVAAIRRYIPNCMISADIIVGFPSETEEEFNETLDMLKELSIYHVHSFPYSERSGTPAAEMPQSVPKEIRNKRNSYLLAECEKVRKTIFDSFNGKLLSVLVEKIEDGVATGHSEEFIETSFSADETIKVGSIVTIKITSNDSNRLYGCKI